ncbi:hypothetical protein OPV22_009229 [Ensete ventricosum]|uniref:DUF3741 domain-containing protein n=1 Tax=Ensete ventricosum TaxID=4639 RepID=A0AAV8RIQ3_ENSVE|nr:hypothetical protein OPV22_009229 [Ensete ventricosum]
MGRMISLFDLSAGMAKTKLLTEKPHTDVGRNCSDAVKKPIYPAVAETQAKQIVNEQRSSSSNKKSGRTPIKLLLSQEMQGDAESRQKPPSVVARLMGLESFPVQRSVSTSRKIRSKGGLRDSLTGELQSLKDDFVDHSMANESRSFAHEKKDYRDVYEIQQQPSKNVWVKDQSLLKARHDENSYQKRMDLVRQKFTEAKRLATDEKLLDSKEFQDAVEVLNSNRDLFLKFLDEPNSLFTKHHLFELQSMSLPSPRRTRITVLKPSIAIKEKRDRSMGRELLADSGESVGRANKHHWSSGFSEPNVHKPQPTRIVVLKPSPGKFDDTKTRFTNNLPMLLDGGVSSGALVTDELVGSREVAKEITRQMQESLSSNRDEALLSSVLSNGYIGDESSFHRSESEFMEDEIGCLSGSEIATPATDYSWDCTNKIGSPFSASSLTRASHSPESSVITEAKKRLSERWASVASNENNQDRFQLQRTLSTLGEMLSIPELKEEGSKEEVSLSGSKLFTGEDDPKVPSAFECTSGTKDEHLEERSCRNLSRSKSAPNSSSACEFVELNTEISSSTFGKPIEPTEVPKSSGRSSFKDKVSGFFFSRSKKPCGDKPARFLPVFDDRLQSISSDPSGKTNDDLSRSADDDLSQPKPVSPDKMPEGSTKVTPSLEAAHSLQKPGIHGNLTQNQDRYSQTPPVLEAPLADGLSQSSGNNNMAERPQALSRSPPIESVVRSLSRSTAYTDAASAEPFNSCMMFSEAEREHEQLVFVDELIASAGMDNRESVTFGGWHSIDSPLNPLLLYESLHVDEEEVKCRERRSGRRLLFDAVNAALLDLSQVALHAAYPWNGPRHEARKNDKVGGAAADQVWAMVRNGMSSEKRVPTESAAGAAVESCWRSWWKRYSQNYLATDRAKTSPVQSKNTFSTVLLYVLIGD